MRKETVVEINGKNIIVNELGVKQIGRVLLLMDQFLEAATEKDEEKVAIKILNMLGGNWDSIVAIMRECCSLGKDVEDLGASDFVDLVIGFMDVNKDFFTKIQSEGLMARLGGAAS